MYTTRHTDMIKEINMDSPIMVIGVGSIGSYATLALAKLGFQNILVIDDGIVEEENIAPQLYKLTDIGRPKVDALQSTIKQMTGTVIRTHNGRFEVGDNGHINTVISTAMGLANNQGKIENKYSPWTTIMACDSMSARKASFKYIKEQWSDYHKDHYIDARMAIEFLTLYSFTLNPENNVSYELTLFSDEDAVQEACTNKAIAYTSAIAGSLIAKNVLDLYKGKHNKGNLRTIQFDIGSLDMVVMK